MTQTLARKVGVLDFMPPELDLVAQCDIGQRPLISPLVQQYQDIVSNYSMKEKDLAKHEKAGHYPKMPGCPVCERAHAQARGARKGGSSKPRSRTANVDLIDWGSCDVMGMRYTATVVCAETHHPTVRCTRTKKGPIVADAVLDAIHEIERLTDSTGEWSLDRLHSDQGSEFKSQLKLQLKRLRIEQTTGEPGHHTDSAIVENFNKMLEHCCTALALTGLETPAMSMQIHSELAMHATDLIRLRSLTPFQKEHGISCMQEQTGEVPDRSILTKAACLSLAYGFVAKEKRSCKLAERAYMAILVGYDKQVKDAVRLVPFKKHADGTVTFYPTKVTKNYKVFDRVYPLAGAPVEYPPLDVCREWMAGDELVDFLADAEVDAAAEARAEAEGVYTVASITAHNRFGDEPDQIEYHCKFDGYDHTHDAYLELSKLDDCAGLISDYWLSQETDTERYERVKSMALVGSGSGGVCTECAEFEPVVCPGGNCTSCCEQSGYTCCMDQHTAHSTQHTAHTHAVGTVDTVDTVDTIDDRPQLLAYCDADAVAHTFRVQQSLSAGELSPGVLVDLGPLLFDPDCSPVVSGGGDSDESMPVLMGGDTSSESDDSVSGDMPNIEDIEVAMPSEHAIALSTLCDDDGAAAVRQMWHYNDLDVLSGPDYLGPECEAKLAFALLHGTDPQLVTLNALHRAGITIYRQLFAILSEHSPLPEQRWIDAVMQQRGQAPGPSFVPFEAGATPQSVANQFDWSTLVNRPTALYSRLGLGVPSDVDFCATAEDSGLTEVNGTADLFSRPGLGVSSDVDFGATAEDSGLTEVPASPNLGCDDRPLAYRRGDDGPDADGSERHRSLLPDSNASGVVQGFVCTTVPTKTHRKPKTDAKRGELSIKEACSPEYLPLFLKGLDRELGEMDRRRFMTEEEAGAISELQQLHALGCRFVVTVKEDGTVKVRLVAKDLKCKRFVDTSESYAGVPSLKAFRLILAARAGYHLSSADLITSYLQADDFADGEYIVLKFWHPIKEEWVYVKSRGYIYGCIPAGAAWQQTYREWMLSIGFTECENATSIYIHKARGTIVSTFVDDPAIWSKTKADEAWFHGELDKRFDVKHHSYLTAETPLTYCGARISMNGKGEVCLDNQPFIEKMLDEWDMLDCSPVRTPVTKGTLARLDEARRKEQFLGKEESTEFRSLLGMLHWLAATTMPKMSVAHSLLAKYTANPVAGCMDALKQAVRFASGCKWECLVMGTGDFTDLKLYSDSDWAGLHSTTGDISSRSGGLITYGGVPVDWWSTKQLSIATSSGDAESRALSTAVQKGLQLQHIAQELGIQTPEQLQTYCDAEAAIGFAKNNGGGSKMKHLDVRLGWIQQIRERGQISLLKVNGPSNPADFFTKVMAKTEFARTSKSFNGKLQLELLNSD